MRFLLFIATVCLLHVPFCSSTVYGESLDLSVKAEAAILMNADTGAILYEKNSRELHYPASITKIATALYALHKKGDSQEVNITAGQEAVGCVSEEIKRRANYAIASHVLVHGGSHIGIKKGEVLSLRDLLYGMMVASGNDAANVIANDVGGTIPEFMQELNGYLNEIGCLSTTFQNPHGLHHPKHRTTAYDMAILTREAMQNPQFRQIVSTMRYTRPKTNKQAASTLMQTNRLLRTGKYHYPKAIGVKTGYLSIAGNTLVAAAKDGDRTLIGVLLKVEERGDMFTDAAKMFETAFSQPKMQRVLLNSGQQKFSLQIPGANQPVIACLNESLTLEYYPAEEPKVKCLLNWDSSLTLPIEENQQVGELAVQLETGQIVKKAPIYALLKVEPTQWQKTKDFFGGSGGKSSYIKVFGAFTLILFLGFFVMQLGRRR